MKDEMIYTIIENKKNKKCVFIELNKIEIEEMDFEKELKGWSVENYMFFIKAELYFFDDRSLNKYITKFNSEIKILVIDKKNGEDKIIKSKHSKIPDSFIEDDLNKRSIYIKGDEIER